MTDDRRAARLLQTWLESEAPERVPTGLLERIDIVTRSARPRPSWVARLEGHHMDVIEGGRRSSLPRLGLVLAIIGLIIAAAGAAALIGSRSPNPITSPTASLAATVASQVATSPAPTATQRLRSTQPGDPVPDELIGVWYDQGGNEFAYYLRAGDPYCITVWHTQQDCLAWYAEGMGGFQRNADIVTIVDGQLRYYSIGLDQGGCKDTASLATYERVGSELHLNVLPDQCFTHLASLTLVGSTGAPSAAPTLPPY
jgi:hypothetical protein